MSTAFMWRGGYQGRGGGRGQGRGRGNACHNAHYADDKWKVCFAFKNTGKCKFGAQCRYSHELDAGVNGSRPQKPIVEENTDRAKMRDTYNTWRRIIRQNPSDLGTMLRLWEDALDILNADDRESKMKLPQDLADGENYKGRKFIKSLMDDTLMSRGTLVKISRAFLLVLTHTTLLDCLSVDTFVGSLYSFVSGDKGKRAVPYFQRLCEAIPAYIETIPKAELETTVVALSVALREILRREQRARLNDDLPHLINNLEETASAVIDNDSIPFHTVQKNIRDLRAMVSRAANFLVDDDDDDDDSASRPEVRSTYPREFPMPCGRYDNDRANFTDMQVFPTRQEILSDGLDFLPSTDRDQPHFLEDQGERLLDTHFRLLRHDTFGEMKNALFTLLNDAEKNAAILLKPKASFGDTHAYFYTNAYVSSISFNPQLRDLETSIAFPQPPQLRHKTDAETTKWWEESKRLQHGTLLSFVAIESGHVRLLFFTVSGRNTETFKEHNIASNTIQSSIMTKLTTSDQTTMASLIDCCISKVKGVLIEFSDMLPSTFVPILENLQGMQRDGRLPFRQWLLPERSDSDQTCFLNIKPPLYARKPAFTFPLRSITGSALELKATASVDDQDLLTQIEEQSGLDRGQSQGLVAALTREFAFIQGPPGTGKSYLGIQIMKVLLELKKTTKLGPMLVVCFTNHALDQFSEHLIQVGVDKIVRIGGRSQSAMLEGHNLRDISKTGLKTKHEGFLVASAFETVEELDESIQGRLEVILKKRKKHDWNYFRNHLQKRHHRVYEQFSKVDDAGFEVAGRHPFDRWKASRPFAAPDDVAAKRALSPQAVNDLIVRATHSVHALTPSERHLLMDKWEREIRAEACDALWDDVKAAHDSHKLIRDVHDEVDRRVLQSADVIAITTTGLAQRIALLQHVECKVVICEEAGEVLEAHMLSTLLPSVEHLIQIGDHQQLRPKVTYNLSMESKQGALHQLDRSQFERLSVGEPGRPKVPVAQLNVQRRMRPEISTLIRETIYPRLVDHTSTLQLPDVVGMRKNVFWLHHENFEDGQQTEQGHNKSKSNAWEVAMVHALVRHIVRQGAYQSSDIAVLTPYVGQLQKLRNAMRNDFEIVLSDRDQAELVKDGFASGGTTADENMVAGQEHKKVMLQKKKLSDLLRLATVDNFQGEEAKIIIISLVRCNKEGKPGFLKTTNRINVLLSRAQHGMYLIGNTETYASVPMWQQVIDMLRATDAVGTSLSLCCPRHPDKPLEVVEPDDFLMFSPEGGCRMACDRRLDCGHKCLTVCHSDSMHKAFSCPQPCERLHSPCNHACQKQTCGEDCGLCCMRIDNVQLPCGHSKDGVPCFRTQNVETIQCTVLVKKTVGGCNHTIEVECHQDVGSDRFRCPTPCGTILPCGHNCIGTCSRCTTRETEGQTEIKHQSCQKVCGRRYGTCNHTCQRKCHDGSSCGPCFAPCDVKCFHTRCDRVCNEACAPCIQQCVWSCEHKGRCTLPCSAPCDRLPCDERCSQILDCGHQCPGICGETCPVEYCHECGMKQDEQVDMLMMSTYAEIDVDETPIVKLGCGHFFTAETLDGMIGMTNVYDVDPAGKITGLKDISSTLSTDIPKCPHCRKQIQQYVGQRYNRVINRAVIDEMTKRFISSGQTRLEELENKISKLAQTLEDIRRVQRKPQAEDGRLSHNETRKIQQGYKEAILIERNIRAFQKEFADRHQPAQKLHEAMLVAFRKKASIENALNGLSLNDASPLTEKDSRIALGGRMLEISISCIVLENKLLMASKIGEDAGLKYPGGSPSATTQPILTACEKFIRECTERSLPKLAVEATLHYARVTIAYSTSGSKDNEARGKALTYRQTALDLLSRALELCTSPFRNSDNLAHAIEETIKMLGREWYEEVTPEELDSIKCAMVSGRGGIATHAGHWYNCANGHPFAIGECGAPMERARCPECGAPIGGQGHIAVAGVTRAESME